MMKNLHKHGITTSRIVELSAEYLQKFDFIEFALLFGSFAEDNAFDLSDVDIGIFVSRDISLLEHGNLIAGMESILKRTTDITVLNDIYKKSPVLAFNIIEKSRLLLCSNEGRYIEFRKYVLLYFMDSNNLRKEINHAFKERLRRDEFGKRDYVRTS